MQVTSTTLNHNLFQCTVQYSNYVDSQTLTVVLVAGKEVGTCVIKFKKEDPNSEIDDLLAKQFDGSNAFDAVVFLSGKQREWLFKWITRSALCLVKGF